MGLLVYRKSQDVNIDRIKAMSVASHIILCHCPVARVDLNYLTRKTSVQNTVDTVGEEEAAGRGKNLNVNQSQSIQWPLALVSSLKLISEQTHRIEINMSMII